MPKKSSKKESLDPSSTTSSKRKKSSSSTTKSNTVATSNEFNKAKELYSDFAPKLQEWGIPLDDLNQKLIDEVLSKITGPIKKLLETLKEATAAGGSASKAVSKLTTSLNSSLTTFTDKVPFKQLVVELPKKLLELIKTLMRGIDNPGLLCPSLACGGASEASAAATGIAGKFLGQQQRLAAYKAFFAKFDNVIGPLKEALPQLQSLPEIFTEIQSLSKKASNGVKAISDLGNVQNDCKKMLDDLLNSVQFKKGENVMQNLENAFSKAQTVDTFSTKLASAGSKFSGALSAVFAFFRSIETLIMKISSVSWNSLFNSMTQLQAHYPTALADARKILKPTGLTAMFLKTSPYLTQIEAQVNDVKSLLNLDEAANLTKSATDGLFGVLQLPSAATKTPAGPDVKQMSQLSVKTLEPIRLQLDQVLSLHKVTDLVLENTTRSFSNVLTQDFTGILQKNMDNFGAAAAKKLADAALAEANKMKEAVLAECQKMKDAAVQAANQMKEEIVAKANEAKAKLMQEAQELRAAADAEVAKLKSQANELKAKAETAFADAKAKAMAEVEGLQAKAASMRANAEKEVQQMKQSMLNEAEQMKKQMMADTEQLKASILGDANLKASSITSNAKNEAQELRSNAMKEIDEMKAAALKEIEQLKASALKELKSEGYSAASGLFKSYF